MKFLKWVLHTKINQSYELHVYKSPCSISSPVYKINCVCFSTIIRKKKAYVCKIFRTCYKID